MYIPYKGASLRIPYNEVPHMFVVMNDPDSDGMCLLTMVTSIKSNRSHDASCILQAGDHSFVRHPSYALFRMAQLSPARHMANMVAKNFYSAMADVTPALYQRIRSGLYASLETSGAILKYARRLGI
jgi:hypothetical protein